jgi:hypothetical protein
MENKPKSEEKITLAENLGIHSPGDVEMDDSLNTEEALGLLDSSQEQFSSKLREKLDTLSVIKEGESA